MLGCARVGEDKRKPGNVLVFSAGELKEALDEGPFECEWVRLIDGEDLSEDRYEYECHFRIGHRAITITQYVESFSMSGVDWPANDVASTIEMRLLRRYQAIRSQLNEFRHYFSARNGRQPTFLETRQHALKETGYDIEAEDAI